MSQQECNNNPAEVARLTAERDAAVQKARNAIIFGHGEVCVATAYREGDKKMVMREVVIYKPKEKYIVGEIDNCAKGKSTDEIDTLVRIRIEKSKGGMELLYAVTRAIEACVRDEDDAEIRSAAQQAQEKTK
jgi:hypothetical protein